MSTENESVADIVRELRNSAERVMSEDHNEDYWSNFEAGQIYYELANRFEAAHERELSKMRPKTGGDFGQFGNVAACREACKEAADACLKPDPGWKERCEKCFENNACEPPECRYFDGEDCQSPIPNQHPMAQPGNVAALREAAETALKTIRGVINSTISPRSNTVFDCRDKLSAALAAPPRNCERFATADDAKREFNYLWNFVWQRGGGCLAERNYEEEFERWLFAYATEQEGESDGN